DQTKDYAKDRYGDEVLPNQVIVDTWHFTPLYNNTYVSVDPLLYKFNAGLNTIKITNTSSSVFRISNIEIYQPTKLDSYQAYKDKQTGNEVNGVIDIKATDYIEKNTSYVQAFAEMNPSLAPFDPVYKKLNVVDGNTWRLPGQSVSYEVEVLQAGLYRLAFRYANFKYDYPVFRSIYINGEIPFEEVKAYQFRPTPSGNWRVETLGNSETHFLFYLEQGINTITLRAEVEPLQSAIRKIQMLIDHINTFTLEVRKITGKDIDKDRTWRFSELIPETKSYIES